MIPGIADRETTATTKSSFSAFKSSSIDR